MNTTTKHKRFALGASTRREVKACSSTARRSRRAAEWYAWGRAFGLTLVIIVSAVALVTVGLASI